MSNTPKLPEVTAKQIIDTVELIEDASIIFDESIKNYVSEGDVEALTHDSRVIYAKRLAQELALQQQAHEEVAQKYQELIMAVESEFVGETRHQTALRYIQQKEEEILAVTEREIETLSPTQSKETDCPACEGTGVDEEHSDGEQKWNCPYCKGTGYAQSEGGTNGK